MTIYARQAASGIYAATSTTGSFNVAPEVIPVTFGAIPAKSFSKSGSFVVRATSAAYLPITYSVMSGPATISGSTVTLTGPAMATLKAVQAAGGNYAVSTGTVSFGSAP